MKRNLKWVGLGAILGTAMLFAMNLPANDFGLYDDLFQSCMNIVKKDCASWAREGGGSEAPRGLSENTRVELANTEKYILSGVVETQMDYIYLHINLRAFPWLASRARVANPYYRIKDSTANWKKYLGQNVTVLVTAEYAVWSQGGHTLFEVVLVPGPDAIISALQP